MESAGVIDIYALTEPCLGNFIDENKVLLINTTVIAGGPIVLYMAFRMIKGLMRAHKGYRLANPKDWF